MSDLNAATYAKLSTLNARMMKEREYLLGDVRNLLKPSDVEKCTVLVDKVLAFYVRLNTNAEESQAWSMSEPCTVPRGDQDSIETVTFTSKFTDYITLDELDMLHILFGTTATLALTRIVSFNMPADYERDGLRFRQNRAVGLFMGKFFEILGTTYGENAENRVVTEFAVINRGVEVQRQYVGESKITVKTISGKHLSDVYSGGKRVTWLAVCVELLNRPDQRTYNRYNGIEWNKKS